MPTTKQNILNRLYIFTIVLFLFAVAVVYKMVNIQLVDGYLYKQESESQTVRKFNIPANRGNIYSSDGSLLATSVSKFDIHMDIKTISDKVFNECVVELAETMAVSDIFSHSSTYYEDRFRNAWENDKQYHLIVNGLSYKEYLEVREFPIFQLGKGNGGFISEERTVRELPIGKIAERFIGKDEIGIGTDGKEFSKHVGLEGNFREYLRGTDGKRLKQQVANGRWKPILDTKEIEAIDGKDIVTTLSVNVQDIVHHALLSQLKKYKAEHGTVVVMETKTGEIKAISNLGITSDGNYYERKNHAVGESHEPGSTFKLMSMVVALEDGVVKPNTIIDTEKGTWKVGGRVVTDSHHEGYGKITAAEVLEKSSNIGIAKIIYRNYKNNPQKFLDGLHRMEIGFPLEIPIKGAGKPYLPNPEVKDKWYGTTLPWMSFGYGVSITPMQTLTFYNAIANNGVMVRPLFVKAIKQQDEVLKVFKTEVINDKICSQSTINKVTKMLTNVVKKGTADNIYNENYFLAGKTGTCKVNYGKGEDKQYISSFVGFFPANKPKYSCIVVIHKPDPSIGYYGNIVAAPVFEKIAQKLYTDTYVVDELNGLKEQFTFLEKSEHRYRVNAKIDFGNMPNLTGMVGMDAVTLLENLGMKVSFKGSGKVKKQSIKKGVRLKKGMAIDLTLL